MDKRSVNCCPLYQVFLPPKPSFRIMNKQEDLAGHTALQAESVLQAFNARIQTIVTRYNGFETFEPQPTDVFIVSWMKSGTTLMQQLIYQLLAATGRVPGDPEGERFNDISEVVPFIEPREATGIKTSINPYEPRVWKSHATCEAFKGDAFRKCRYIYCIRDGLQVAPSFLDFTLDWVLDNSVKGEELRKAVYHKFFLHNFLGMIMMPDGTLQKGEPGHQNVTDWVTHVRGFLEAPLESTLFLIYEDAVEDMKKTVRRIGNFLSVPVTDEVVNLVASKCARETMANDSRFNDTTISKMTGLDIRGGIRVRQKDAPGFKNVKLPESSLEVYEKMFQQAFGVKDYSELVENIRKRNAITEETLLPRKH